MKYLVCMQESPLKNILKDFSEWNLHVAYQTLQQDFMKTRYLGYISRTIAIIKFSCNISPDEQLMVSNKTNFQWYFIFWTKPLYKKINWQNMII